MASMASCRPESGVVTAKSAPLPATDTDRPTLPRRDSSELEKLFVRNSLVNISELDSDIRVVLLYSTDKNFTGRVMYRGLDQCYLPCEVAIKLGNAQRYLEADFPLYSLVVFDATRPVSVQKMMWDSLNMKPTEKYNYVARPDELSLHNYGAAVDVGIISRSGILLDMGTPFDHFGELAQPKLEAQLYRSGQLSKMALRNRLLLRHIMMRAGFNPITSEWWHFNACTKTYAATHYKLIE